MCIRDRDRDILVAGGNYLGYFAWSTPGGIWDTEAKVGMDLTTLKIIDGYTAGDRFQNILWSVPITTVDKVKAVEALNYIYEHDEAAWLLQYGIEGQDYEVLEEKDVYKRQVRILAEPEQDTLKGDGQDICYIRIMITDENGVRLPAEEREIQAELTGPAVPAALGSGNPCTEDQIGQMSCHTSVSYTHL